MKSWICLRVKSTHWSSGWLHETVRQLKCLKSFGLGSGSYFLDKVTIDLGFDLIYHIFDLATRVTSFQASLFTLNDEVMSIVARKSAHSPSIVTELRTILNSDSTLHLSQISPNLCAPFTL
ncbi:hypothetical protein K470DRAFT_255810 [Piedraia hortae CBS 480.64]|uniref:Uncharacterized protein n=1 Tax=Piedraia hortae CBS 480.64 TaxID=1314780 RepID=A0A6A7C6B9_9PEZI|nr:hypothetical protein K470DRAFT_255810 [Piedraia hortae CBS 480.64]